MSKLSRRRRRLGSNRGRKKRRAAQLQMMLRAFQDSKFMTAAIRDGKVHWDNEQAVFDIRYRLTQPSFSKVVLPSHLFSESFCRPDDQVAGVSIKSIVMDVV